MLRSGIPDLGQLQCESQLHYREAPTQILASPTMPRVSVSLAPSCDNGGTIALHRESPLVAPQAEGRTCHNGTSDVQKVPRKVKSNSPQGNAVGGWEQLPTCAKSPPWAQPS